MAGKVRPPSRGAYVGVYKSNLPWEVAALDRYAAESSGKAPAIVMWYQAWGPRTTNPYSAEKFLTSQVKAVLDRGAIPMITWEPWNPGGDPNYLTQPAKQPTYQLADINAGYYDNYIRTWARAVKSVGGPVMIRPMHEMNGMWYPWCGPVNGNSPAQFRAAWRRIHTIFRREGATNVTWVWSPAHRSYPGTYQNRIEAYYPGDAYVDWIGLSGFNWGTSRPGLRWTTFADVYTYPLALHEEVQQADRRGRDGDGFVGRQQGGVDQADLLRDALALPSDKGRHLLRSARSRLEGRPRLGADQHPRQRTRLP